MSLFSALADASVLISVSRLLLNNYLLLGKHLHCHLQLGLNASLKFRLPYATWFCKWSSIASLLSETPASKPLISIVFLYKLFAPYRAKSNDAGVHFHLLLFFFFFVLGQDLFYITSTIIPQSRKCAVIENKDLREHTLKLKYSLIWINTSNVATHTEKCVLIML